MTAWDSGAAPGRARPGGGRAPRPSLQAGHRALVDDERRPDAQTSRRLPAPVLLHRAAPGLGLAQLSREFGQQGVPHLRPVRLPDSRPGVLQRARVRAPPAGLVPGAGRADLAPGAIRELRDPDATDEDDE